MRYNGRNEGIGKYAMHAQQEMLNDGVRLSLFREALAARVRPGDVVLDAGTGTGVLAVMAAQAGAAHVYAVDNRGVADLARQVAGANGVADRITVIRGDVRHVALPRRVDGMVCELLGYAGLAEGITRLLPRVLERHVRPGGWCIPGNLRVWVAPVEHAALHERILLAHADHGVDLGPVRDEIVQHYWVEHLAGADMPAAPGLVRVEDWAGDTVGDAARENPDMAVRRHAAVHGFGVWFTAQLAPGVLLDTGPHAPPTSWRQVFLPLPQPLSVRTGDTLRLELATLPMPHGEAFHWKTAHLRGGQTLFKRAFSNALSCMAKSVLDGSPGSGPG